MVTVPASTVAEVVEACRAKGVHGLVVMTAGFADAGLDGADAQRQLVAVARGAGMRVLGPNCLGLVNTDPSVRMNATLAPVVPPPGRIGFFCQSGALGIAILADAATRGLGLSTFVSAGNRADVSGNDLLQFWHGDDRTEVVLLYLESFGNPAQVRPAGPGAGQDETGHRGEVRPARDADPRRRGRTRRRCPRPRWPACSRSPG